MVMNIFLLFLFKLFVIFPLLIEKAIRTPNAVELPQLIAQAKADAIIHKLQSSTVISESIILTSDQIVVYENEIREKPESREQAIAYLQSYSNHSVSTVSALVITHYPSLIQEVGVDVATIHWQTISNDIIETVVNKGDIFTSAGGFRIEDPLLSPLIAQMDGSVDSIMGLPIDLMLELMDDVMEQVNCRSEKSEKQQQQQRYIIEENGGEKK
jgi:septum formation protein